MKAIHNCYIIIIERFKSLDCAKTVKIIAEELNSVISVNDLAKAEVVENRAAIGIFQMLSLKMN